MQSKIYEQALLALAMYRMAQTDSTEEMTAIGCVIRNLVRYHNLTYSEVIENLYGQLAEEKMPIRGYPPITDPILIDPVNGLLTITEKIYRYDSLALPDITSDHNHPQGASFFAKVSLVEPNSKFDMTILQRQELHVCLGQWGAQNFYT